MKIPYIKLYAADLLAASRHVTSEQLGDAILGVCELSFENKTLYQPQTPREKAFFELLLNWKKEATAHVNQKKQAGRLGAKKRWGNKTVLDGSTATSAADSTPNSHTEPDTETEPEPDTETETDSETETENIFLTAQGKPAQGKREISLKEKKPPLPAEFTDQVIAHFESAVQTPVQRTIFIKRNARCLKDILDFCDHDITLALQTISVCIDRLAKEGLTGGYEAVCRNLPEYYETAKAELAKQAYEKVNK